MMYPTWSGVSEGSTPSRSAAAALTCGAANDVPIASRSSNGPQSEYASVQPESAATRFDGIVENMSSPGAATSTYTASRFE